MAKGPMALWLLDGGAQLLDVPHYIGPWFCESFPAKPFGGQWWILFGEVHFDGPWSDGFVGIVQRSGTGWQCGKCLELLGKSGRINLPWFPHAAECLRCRSTSDSLNELLRLPHTAEGLIGRSTSHGLTRGFSDRSVFGVGWSGLEGAARAVVKQKLPGIRQGLGGRERKKFATRHEAAK